MDDNPATHTEAAQHLAAAGRHVGQHTRPAGPSVETRLGDLERTVKALAGTVGQLANIVSRVAAPAGASPAPTRRTAAASDELVDWVAWLIRRYEITSTITDCWAQHGALVEELDALRITWHTTGDGGTQWHDQLDRALTRIDGRWRTCTDQHRAKTLPLWVTPHDPDPPPPRPRRSGNPPHAGRVAGNPPMPTDHHQPSPAASKSGQDDAVRLALARLDRLSRPPAPDPTQTRLDELETTVRLLYKTVNDLAAIVARLAAGHTDPDQTTEPSVNPPPGTLP